jgi:hypothetical protein
MGAWAQIEAAMLHAQPQLQRTDQDLEKLCHGHWHPGRSTVTSHPLPHSSSSSSSSGSSSFTALALNKPSSSSSSSSSSSTLSTPG